MIRVYADTPAELDTVQRALDRHRHLGGTLDVELFRTTRHHSAPSSTTAVDTAASGADDATVSYTEAAELLGVHRNTVGRLAGVGRLVKVGRRITRSSLAAHLRGDR